MNPTNLEFENGVGMLGVLPKELLFYLISFCNLRDIVNLDLTSKSMHDIINQDEIWKYLFEKSGVDLKKPLKAINREGTSWRQLYQRIKNWKWGPKKAREIHISKDGLTCIRSLQGGRNPAILSSSPLTRRYSWFRVKIESIGNWVGIGFAESNFELSGSNTLGTQSLSINSSYFWQVTGIHKLQMHGEIPVDEVSTICVGDVIDIKVDFDSNMVYFFNNEILQGVITCTHQRLIPGVLFPAANLSYQTSVAFQNYDVFDDFDQRIANFEWRWGTTLTKRAPTLTVSSDGHTVQRTTTFGLNPAVMGLYPLSRRKSSFSLEIKKLGKWVGIGVCDNHFKLTDSKTLGTQSKSVNSAYFYQDSGVNKLQMFGEIGKDDAKPMSVGDIIDVQVDFEKSRIMYFLNGQLQGFIEPRNIMLVEGTLFPCVDMAVNTKVTLLNEDLKRDFELNRKWKKLLRELPTSWEWSIERNKKAPTIDVVNRILARREKRGNDINPAVIASEPLTRACWYFVVKVLKLGDWVGIGVAEKNFQVNQSGVLGEQDGMVNCCYFFQKSKKHRQRLKTRNEPDKFDVYAIQEGDYIGIEVDFGNNKIHFYNNDILQGTVKFSEELDGKIFPCVDLSAETEVIFVNEADIH